jgi:hypothetical protein
MKIMQPARANHPPPLSHDPSMMASAYRNSPRSRDPATTNRGSKMGNKDEFKANNRECRQYQPITYLGENTKGLCSQYPIAYNIPICDALTRTFTIGLSEVSITMRQLGSSDQYTREPSDYFILHILQSTRYNKRIHFLPQPRVMHYATKTYVYRAVEWSSMQSYQHQKWYMRSFTHRSL